MFRLLPVYICLLFGCASAAWSQASPVSVAPMSSPMTPGAMRPWLALPVISRTQAKDDAEARGYTSISRLQQDDYGNWFGNAREGDFVVWKWRRCQTLDRVRAKGLRGVGQLPARRLTSVSRRFGLVNWAFEGGDSRLI